MNIGQASGMSEISPKMIRYYESVGLLSPARSEAGYRRYDAQDIHTLKFLRRARDLGFSVDQMRDLLALWNDRSRASADVKAMALRHISTLESKATALQEMADTLRHLAHHCHGDERPDCPIIDELASPSTHGSAPSHQDAGQAPG